MEDLEENEFEQFGFKLGQIVDPSLRCRISDERTRKR